MNPTEWWTLAPVPAPAAGAGAADFEAEGWTGALFCDTQNALGDVYAGLTLAAGATRTLKIGTGVTNPLTRHPASTAAAPATVQAISGGRMVLGIGRGDSSGAFIGLAPLAVGRFERYLAVLRQFLHGEGVDMTESASFAVAESFAALGLATAHEVSTLRWLDPAVPTVPIDVAASGPAVIRTAARHADRVTFTVGASVDRLAWALDTGRRAAADAGRDPDSISWGAYVNVVCDDDPQRAVALGIGALAPFARMSVMRGVPVGEMPDRDREMLVALHRGYDMTTHGQNDNRQAGVLERGEFADRFAVLGTPDHCVTRLRALAGLGLSRIVVLGAAVGVPEADAAAARRKLVAEVLPRVGAPAADQPVAVR